MPNSASLANLKPAWTPEDAAAAARRGWEKRRANPKPKQADPPQDQSKADPADAKADTFNARRLLRVRKQLTRLDDLMDQENDPAKLDRLASAQARLSEQERILRGEPLPGSRRPAPDRADRRQGRATWTAQPAQPDQPDQPDPSLSRPDAVEPKAQ